MLRSDYTGQNCSVARALEIVGERWTILILRESFLGTRRFDEFQRNLGIARNVLQARLQRLVDGGILARVRYQERPARYEYRLTHKGTDLWPALVALMQWGDRHAAPGGPPVVLEHRDCGGTLDGHRRCTRCGADLDAWDVIPTPGPGLSGPSRPRARSAARSADRRGSHASPR
ncbi:MAG TPA: helix-turn-helix domain-containing protein [Solirubrobacteraceae bacterium]|jgi:DNA-binding HxlR family transcriptional regulator|nr:helix-turn-helix domain-containing protein [Solirubrobacteraceae bacterium]